LIFNQQEFKLGRYFHKLHINKELSYQNSLEYKMKNSQTVFQKLVVIILFINLLLSFSIYSQQVSAEFMSSLDPISLSTGEKVEDGVRGVMYHNGKLYVTNIWAGIQCVNVDDIRNPKEIGKYETEHRPHNIFVGDNYCYVSDELAGITILDVSDPKNPRNVGKIETLGDAFWVEAQYPYVYVAEADFGVQVYDVTDINNPVRLGGFDTNGWAWYLTLRENLVYVGDKNGGLQIFDFSDKTKPVRYGQYKNLNSARTVFVDENYAYIANGANGMTVLDISNPKFPALVSTYPTTGYIFDLFKAGKNVYLADEINRRLEILNVADPKKPELQGYYQSDAKVYSVWKKDVYVFVAADDKVLLLRHNNPPTLAVIEDQTVDEVAALTITPVATEPDGDAFHFEIKNLPEGATFDSLKGYINWTPTYEQSGKYKDITLTVIEETDTKLSASRTFSITVNHVNRPPVMAQVADTSTFENMLLTFGIKEGTDPDKEDTGKLKYKAENLPEGAIFDPVARKFSWTPTYEQSGVYTIDFVIEDPVGATDRDASTITVIHVDRKPEIVAVESMIFNENEKFSIQVKGSDPDKEDQNAISFRAENLPEGAIFDATTQILSWTPTFDQSGLYKDVLLIMTAGKLSDSTKFDLTVNHVNRPPELNLIAAQKVDENKTLKFYVSGFDGDSEDAGKLKYTAMNLPEGAVFNPDSLSFTWTPSFEQSGVYENPTFTVTDPAGLSDSKSVSISVNHVNRPPVLNELQDYIGDENVAISLKITGSDPDVEDKDKQIYSAVSLPEGATFTGQNFSWTPSFDQSGQYSVTFTISDGVLSDSKSMNFIINHVNRAPVIDSIAAQNVDENKQLTFSITANDPDVEDAGKFTLSATDLPEGANFDPGTASFKWTPTFEQSGDYVVTFTNTDPAGLSISKKARIKVNHVNRTPVFNPLVAQTVEENTTLTYVIPKGEDPDKEDANILKYTALNLPEGAVFDQSTMTLTWTPTYEQSGDYTSSITLTDGEFTVEQPLTIKVTHVNRPPEMQILKPQNIDENKQLQFSIISSDPDKEDEGKTKLNSTELPQGAIFDAKSGSFSWTPTYEQSGEYSVTFTITDVAGLTASQTATINVNHVNRPPSLNPVVPQTTNENIPLSFSLVATDADKEDEGKLEFSCTNLPQGATLDATSGTFSWTPTFLQAGSYKLDFKVTDSGELSATQTVEVTVTNVNRAPVLNPVEDGSVYENSVIAFTLSGKDEDSDDELVYSLSELPDGAKFNEKSGSFSWTPNYNQAGEYNLTASLSDGKEQSNATFKIVVNNVNRRPEIDKGGSVTITVGETANLSFSGSDPDDDAIAFSSDNLPEGATINANGEFSWTPDENQIGTFVFTVKVSDGTDSAQTSASVNVKALPSPPPEPSNLKLNNQ
jgi:hypothetical protein